MAASFLISMARSSTTNGFKVVEYQRGTNIYGALIARSKYAEIGNFGLSEEGTSSPRSGICKLSQHKDTRTLRVAKTGNRLTKEDTTERRVPPKRKSRKVDSIPRLRRAKAPRIITPER